MENVVISRLERHQWFAKNSSTQFTLDSTFGEENHFYFLNNTRLYLVKEVKPTSAYDDQPKLLHDCEVDYEGDLHNSVVSMVYHGDLPTIQLIMQSGSIINLHVHNCKADGLHNSTMDVTSNIVVAKHSHDQHILAVLTSDNEVILYDCMNGKYGSECWNESLPRQASYHLAQDEYGAGQMVNVNWGSKATQFHGQGMRDQRSSTTFEILPLNPWDDGKCTLDWRKDDKYFVVNAVSAQGFRSLKIFYRNGVLMHTSEYVAGLEKHVAWKPGQDYLIACSLMSPQKHKIVFFETNGLFRSDFELAYAPGQFQIQHLSWSPDASLFLVVGRQTSCVDDLDKQTQSILLFTEANRVWYLKQKVINLPSQVMSGFHWQHRANVNLLRAIDHEQNLVVFEFKPIINMTPQGETMVVQGSRLLVNTFGNSIVPPPYSNYEICFKDACTQIMQIACNHSSMVLVLSNDRIALFNRLQSENVDSLQQCKHVEYSFTNVTKDVDSIFKFIILQDVVDASKITNALLDAEGTLHGVMNDHIVSFLFQQHQQLCLHPTNLQVRTLHCYSLNKFLFSSNNGFHVYDSITSLSTSHLGWLGHVHQVMVYDEDGKKKIIVLTRDAELFADHKLITKSKMNSIMIYDDRYLLATSHDGHFYCWPFKACSEANKQLPSQANFRARPIEKSAKLVGFSKSEAKIVLQMSRGNLEAFYPIDLVLDQVDHHLDGKQYRTAFEVLRRHRINLNYLVDYDSQSFHDNCCTFIQQIGMDHPDWICLFLAELSDVDHRSRLRQNVKTEVKGKQDALASLFHEKMVEMDVVRYLHPILHTFARRQPADIGGALAMIKALNNTSVRDEAIKFMLYIVPADQLFDEALGTYDLHILLMIASKSAKDPKEYVALVNYFKNIQDEPYRRYRIDLHLKRYDKALVNLAKCENSLEEALELIEKRHLYKQAIVAYGLEANNDPRYKDIWLAYGRYLFSKKYYAEAAMAHGRAHDWLGAMKMHQMHGAWHMAVVCARHLAGDDANELKRLLRLIAQQLVLNGQHLDGAFIFEHYLHDAEEAYSNLLAAHFWTPAFRVAHDAQLELDQLRQALLKHYDYLLEMIRDCGSQLEEHCHCLDKLKNERAFGANNHGKDRDDLDAYSDTTSLCGSISSTGSWDRVSRTGSVVSLKTNRSGRSSARAERKRASKRYVLKVGSANEDIQRIFALKEAISVAKQMFAQAKEMVNMLYELSFVQQSRNLQNLLAALHKQVVDAIELVWDNQHFVDRMSDDESLKPKPIVSANIDWKLVLN